MKGDGSLVLRFDFIENTRSTGPTSCECALTKGGGGCCLGVDRGCQAGSGGGGGRREGGMR